MVHKCPSCKSYNARRSTVRKSEITLRHIFLSPYRCRDCRTRFWVLSKKSVYFAGVLVASTGIGALLWIWADANPEAAPAEIREIRLADLGKRAASNDPSAEYDLARMHAIGDGVPKSAQIELKWLKRAAEHGHAQAQYEYGMALREGRGTVQDFEGARKMIQLAAEAGVGPAQLALGKMYRTGAGVAADNVKAYVWLNVAAAQGVPGAAAARDTMLPRLSPAELLEAQAQSRRMAPAEAPTSVTAQ
jgi:hypothetical protein